MKTKKDSLLRIGVRKVAAQALDLFFTCIACMYTPGDANGNEQNSSKWRSTQSKSVVGISHLLTVHSEARYSEVRSEGTTRPATWRQREKNLAV